MIPDGPMDLVTGPCSDGKSKVVRQCTLPLPVNLVITKLAVIEPSDQGLVLKERAPGVTVENNHRRYRSLAHHSTKSTGDRHQPTTSTGDVQ